MIAAALFALAQPMASAAPVALRPVEQNRLALCLERARRDPAGAIIDADSWVSEASGAEASLPHQCLGQAYTALLRWDAAERAFLTAREAATVGDHDRRARLAAMAANAALAEQRARAALDALDLAAADSAAAENPTLRAEVEVDRARALVLAGNEVEASQALASARALDPQNSLAWLLSATLARRLDDLDRAQAYIQTAAQLAPRDPEIGLEAGIIAVLSGRAEAAEASWRSVMLSAPDSEAAATARGYLAQLGEAAPQEVPGR